MPQYPVFTIPTIDVEKGQPMPGSQKYAAIPRVGDFITVNTQEGHDIYQVVAVNFSQVADMGATADMFVRRMGKGPVQKYIAGNPLSC